LNGRAYGIGPNRAPFGNHPVNQFIPLFAFIKKLCLNYKGRRTKMLAARDLEIRVTFLYHVTGLFHGLILKLSINH
jgi:hypothetical protein